MRRAALALVASSRLAHADGAKPPEARPDPLAEQEASEANLESNAPRSGMTFAFAAGPGLILSGGKSARVPAASFRIGHVATQSTVLTFEFVGGTFFHTIGGMTLVDGDVSVLAGGQYYMNTSVWIRGAGGLGVHTVDDGTASGKKTLPGPAGVFGAGVDLVRRHYLVLGLEAFFAASINRDGLTSLGALCLGLSYY